jgi:hypothetical protein
MNRSDVIRNVYSPFSTVRCSQLLPDSQTVHTHYSKKEVRSRCLPSARHAALSSFGSFGDELIGVRLLLPFLTKREETRIVVTVSCEYST